MARLSTAARERALTTLGILFCIIGGFTLFGFLAGYAVAHVARFAYLGYGALDILIGYAALTRQRWLLWAFAANLVAYACLMILRHATLSMLPGLLLNALFALIAWWTRGRLRTDNRIAMGVFFAVWALTMGYTIWSTL